VTNSTQLAARTARVACMNHYRAFLSLLNLFGAPLIFVACSADSGAGQSIVDTCNGTYVCVIEGSVVDSRLIKTRVGRCYLGSLELGPDGTSPPVDGHAYTWSGNASRLEICEGAHCFACYPNGASSGSPSSGSPSSGSPSSGSPSSGSPSSGSPSSGGATNAGPSSGGATNAGPSSGGATNAGRAP